MPLTKLRTSNLLSGSVDSGSLGPGSITGHLAASTADDADLILIYDDDASALRKMTRANFTAGITGDITAVTAGNGLSGGGNSGDVTLALDVNELSALGTEAESTDFLVMEDVTDNSTKKVLVSNLPIDTTLQGAYTGGRIVTASNGPIDLQRTSNNASATTFLKLAVSGSVGSAAVAGPEILFGIPVSGDSEIGGSIRCTKWSTNENESNGELQFLVTGNDESLVRILKVDYTGVAVQGLGSSEVFPSSGYAFMVAASGEPSAVSVVNSNGNVGIGVQNAQNPLHVYKSSTSTEPFLEIENVSSGDAALMFSIDGDSYAVGIDNNDGDKFKISYATSAGGARLGANDWLTITPDGKVGLSQAVPEAQFEIQNTSLDPADDFGDPANYHMLIRGSSTNNDYMGIALGSSGQCGAAILHQDVGSYSKGDLVFMTKASTSNGAAPVERMRIDSDGNVGIGTSPSYCFHVEKEAYPSPSFPALIHQTSTNSGADLLRLKFSGGNGDAMIYGENVTFGRIYLVSDDGDGTSTVNTTFTGFHDTALLNNDDLGPGLIVESTGQPWVKNPSKSYHTMLPCTQLCSSNGSKAVFGVLGMDTKRKIYPGDPNRAEDEDGNPKTKIDNPNFGGVRPGAFPGLQVDNPLPADHVQASVMSVGEGAIWVTNINGEIQNGDLIESSTIPGHGRLQSDDIMRSKTVAKCTEQIDWSSIVDTVSHQGSSYKKYLATCTFHCG